MSTNSFSSSVSDRRLLAVAGFVAAAAPVTFSIAFFVVLPARGFDPDRFGDAAHVLDVFGRNPLLLRAVGVNNVALMVTAFLVALLSPARLAPSSELARAAGAVAALGWALYLVGEVMDLTAYLSLPSAAKRGVDVGVAFLTLQHAGRVAHMFAYLLIGAGMIGLALRLELSRAVGGVGVVAGVLNGIVFAVDCFSTTLGGDAGAGGLFNALLGVDTLLIAAWHGALGARLWRTA